MACRNAQTNTYAYTQTPYHSRTDKHNHTPAYTHTKHTKTHKRAHTHKQIHLNAHTHTRTHAHTYTRTHAHTHKYKQLLINLQTSSQTWEIDFEKVDFGRVELHIGEVWSSNRQLSVGDLLEHGVQLIHRLLTGPIWSIKQPLTSLQRQVGMFVCFYSS